jgi:hypothetical protein
MIPSLVLRTMGVMRLADITFDVFDLLDLDLTWFVE